MEGKTGVHVAKESMSALDAPGLDGCL